MSDERAVEVPDEPDEKLGPESETLGDKPGPGERVREQDPERATTGESAEEGATDEEEVTDDDADEAAADEAAVKDSQAEAADEG